jgi:hypothetical protein
VFDASVTRAGAALNGLLISQRHFVNLRCHAHSFDSALIVLPEGVASQAHIVAEGGNKKGISH